MVQFILTEDEMNTLRLASLKGDKAPDTEELQKLCTLAANHVPVHPSWTKEPLIWGCILSDTSEQCDECPALKVCPHPHKEWSK